MPTLDSELVRGLDPAVHTDPYGINYTFERAHPRDISAIGNQEKLSDEEIAFLREVGFEIIYGKDINPKKSSNLLGLGERPLSPPYLELSTGVHAGDGMVVTICYSDSRIEQGIKPSDSSSRPELVVLSRLELAAIQCSLDQTPTKPLQVLISDTIGIGIAKELQAKYPGTKEYSSQRT